MSHLHIPDGILPPIWWVPGYILTAIILVILIKTTKKEDLQRKMPLAGVGAASCFSACPFPWVSSLFT